VHVWFPCSPLGATEHTARHTHVVFRSSVQTCTHDSRPAPQSGRTCFPAHSGWTEVPPPEDRKFYSRRMEVPAHGTGVGTAEWELRKSHASRAGVLVLACGPLGTEALEIPVLLACDLQDTCREVAGSLFPRNLWNSHCCRVGPPGSCLVDHHSLWSSSPSFQAYTWHRPCLSAWAISPT
jgi:hypothetical protein